MIPSIWIPFSMEVVSDLECPSAILLDSACHSAIPIMVMVMAILIMVMVTAMVLVILITVTDILITAMITDMVTGMDMVMDGATTITVTECTIPITGLYIMDHAVR